MNRLKRAIVILSVAGIIGVGAVVSTAALAGQADPKTATDREKRLAEGEREAKKMLLLMDKDNNGKVSKQEFMNFMDAEFDRLDINKDGQLDVNELTHSRVTIRSRGR